MYYNLFDSHMHTKNSPDAHHTAQRMCEVAIDKGVFGIAITDHCEIDRYLIDEYEVRIQNSYMDVMAARAEFEHKLVISHGIEIGQATENIPLTEEILNKYAFDFVLGSQHCANGTDFYVVKTNRLTEDEIYAKLEEYYTYMLKLVKWGKFDVLAHLTYPIRYITGRDGIKVDITRFSGLIETILRTMVEKGIGLEVNSSGYRQGLHCPMPSIEYIRRYREMGGEIVTIGSDSHTAQTIGQNIPDAMRLLEQCGFRYFTFFRRRKPEFLRII